ncbi:nuclear transport factor 2 family protein [Bordetella petrii]|uniref:nuclear transport factor 2 family protein n=1 Tax=Bordetella petrii TaxID=94624 RepID=UPI001E3A6117|nr:nuclear transport factor 2 family protein [Bordetella petrii]MCD0504592.1 nuclear transport factor 2 family protein [Bordetella petrii]
MKESQAKAFFDRYQRFFNRALGGDLDLDELAALYAPEFIAASPAGVAAGKNDEQLKQAMAQGYARYRALGTKAMRVRAVRLSAIDGLHCVAHVAWTATYARQGQADLNIDFDVHYLMQEKDGQPKVFGWVSGDEQALLRQHGIV